MFRLFLILSAVVLAACTPRPGLVVLPDPPADVVLHDVLFATTRDAIPGEAFGIDRSDLPRYGTARITVPPAHVEGQLEVTGQAPDPQRHFAFAALDLVEGRAGFRAELRAALAQNRRAGGQGEAVIFVHGFNNNFAEGLFRVAQLKHDFRLSGVMVHYAWPSRGSPFGYAYDRDSVLFARDGLEALIADMRAAGARSVLLVGHSMGAHLVMEGLRQTEIATPGGAHRAVDGVVLISPDIDVDVFRAQAARIGTLPDPFVIFVSRRDRALQLSARISGETNRLGTVDNVDQVAALDLTIIDVTDFSSPRRDLGHFTVGTSPALIRLLAQLPGVDAVIRGDAARRPGLLEGTVLTVQNATKIVMSPITALAE